MKIESAEPKFRPIVFTIETADERDELFELLAGERDLRPTAQAIYIALMSSLSAERQGR